MCALRRSHNAWPGSHSAATSAVMTGARNTSKRGIYVSARWRQTDDIVRFTIDGTELEKNLSAGHWKSSATKPRIFAPFDRVGRGIPGLRHVELHDGRHP